MIDSDILKEIELNSEILKTRSKSSNLEGKNRVQKH